MLAVESLHSVCIDYAFRTQFNDYYPDVSGGKPDGRSLGPVSTIEARGGGALAQMLPQAGALDFLNHQTSE